MTVERVEALEGFTRLAEVQATIREHTVHVKEHHTHRLRAQQQLGREVQRGTQRRQIRRHGAMLTGEDAFE